MNYYEALGGGEGVRALVERFYAHMESLPDAAPIRALHPEDLTGSREKLFKFLSGWLGGPPLYLQEHGHPRLRARHLPFPIGTAERDQWMMCMERAMEELNIEPQTRREILDALFRTADHMRNQPGD